MLTHALNALARKRNSLGEKEKGFTLIELLVVVIIIGILAAIAIPVYLGVQDNAKYSATMAQVTSAKTAIVAQLTTDPSVTPTLTSATGFTPSASIPVVVQWVSATDPTKGFCVSGSDNAATPGHLAAIDDHGAAIKGATCTGGVAG